MAEAAPPVEQLKRDPDFRAVLDVRDRVGAILTDHRFDDCGAVYTRDYIAHTPGYTGRCTRACGRVKERARRL